LNTERKNNQNTEVNIYLRQGRMDQMQGQRGEETGSVYQTYFERQMAQNAVRI